MRNETSFIVPFVHRNSSFFAHSGGKCDTNDLNGIHIGCVGRIIELICIRFDGNGINGSEIVFPASILQHISLMHSNDDDDALCPC